MNTKAEWMAEAARCLQCRNAPCVAACPAHNPIPRFMKAVKTGDLAEAKSLWDETSNLPEICGRLCQNETLCVGHCTMNKLGNPLKIGILEAAVADQFLGEIAVPTLKNGKKHLVVGLGPAGIANAMEMAKSGYSVDAIDANSDLGGALDNLIPAFRFDKTSLESIRQKFLRLDIQVRYGITVGKDLFLNDLLPRYDSVFLACGSDLPQESDLEGEGIPVWYAHDLLNRHLHSNEQIAGLLGSRVAVVGLGNVAVDMARVLIRLGKHVTIVYRRSVEEAPAGKHEIAAAVAEGVLIKELRLPHRCRIDRGRKTLECDRTAVVVGPDGKKTIQTVPGFEESFEVDDIVFATGQRSSDRVFAGTDLRLRPDLSPYATSDPKILVGGDRINKDKRIVDAMVSGIAAARMAKGETR